MRATTVGCVLAALVSASAGQRAAATPAASHDHLAMAPFGDVAVARPSSAVRRVLLLVSDSSGLGRTEAALADALAGDGALVASIDLPAYLRAIGGGKSHCAYAAAHFEALSQGLQKHLALPTYLSPVLVGSGAGGTLVYAVLAEAPPATFRGAVSLGFSARLASPKPLCTQNHLAFAPADPGPSLLAEASALNGAWVVVPDPKAAVPPVGWSFTQSGVARLAPAAPSLAVVESALARLDALAEPTPPPPSAAEVADLPLIELPTAAAERDELAVIYSGDGGWAGLDRDVGAALVAAGVPVVGVSSLQYFWTRRTPEGAAVDLARTLRHYLAAWHRRRAVLVGYSAGADVLPFLVARLPEDLRARVAAVALLGPSETANFEFHVAEWLGHEDDSARPVAPEVRRLAGIKVLCFYGEEESDSLCPRLPAGSVKLFPEQGAHHFGGHYDVLARSILEELAPVTKP
jgi:type IV secretory pathway VirJ component